MILARRKADRFEITGEVKEKDEELLSYVRKFRFFKDGQEILFENFAEILGDEDETGEDETYQG